ncbi:hypothetical protein GCM10010169_51990 [Micromonospora fulviviridis]|uniref:hypothetical protein n=1 Tax=Micromonospora fulviviridis TaxID=47860 RepID=UPI0019CD6C31|nr:hypothetical protein [Micromonospora fulviviridis]GGS00926.1 hypothetical protein GCM10010169_51990 [Micromonospora fulviviridis]
MPDQLFSDLYRDTDRLTWAPVEEVRRRGRQRTRRARVAGVLAVAVAVGVLTSGAAVLAGHRDATPPLPPATVVPSTPGADPTVSPTPSAESSPSPDAQSSRRPTGGTPSSRPPSRAIPAGATLQLADLPPGFAMSQGRIKVDWTLESAAVSCENRLPALSVGALADRFAVFDSPTAWLAERVTRHSQADAVTSMKRVRRIVADCVPARPDDSLSILAEGLGGDDGVLVGGEIKGIPSRWLFVRQGDLVAQLRLDHQATPDEARHFAKLVADRLCVGTDAC